MSISFFDDLGGLFLHFCQLLSLRSLGQSSEVESNPKTSISFFDDVGGLFSHPVNFCHSDRSSDHQKLNVIQKPTFHFLKFFFNPGGGGTLANSNLTSDKKKISDSGWWGEGGVHHQEPKCHVDPKSNQNSS